MATEHQWKQLCEGIRRGDVGPFDQTSLVRGQSITREYRSDGVVVASMRVYGANSDLPSYECRRVYAIGKRLTAAVAHIRVLTDEEWQEWDDAEPGFDDRAWLAEKGVL